MWYETASVVSDHVYGGHFPVAGGGGFVESADLIHKAECAVTRPEMSRALSPRW